MIKKARLELLIATGNPGKIREIRESLEALPIKLRLLQEFFNVSPVKETGRTYKENAILKALTYSKQTGAFALADDSGLEVDLLGGLPGVNSARFGGEHSSNDERIAKLLAELSHYPNRKRTARFVCFMALAGWKRDGAGAQSDGADLLNVTEGKCEGAITHELRGDNGFGFDPVFRPRGYDATFAQLPSSVKGIISHRAKALAAMREFLEHWIN